MRQEIRRKQLCWLLIAALLFSGMCVRLVCTDKEMSLSLAGRCRAVCNIYTRLLFDAQEQNHHGLTARGIQGSGCETVYWMPVRKIFFDSLLLLQEISKAAPLGFLQKGDFVIGYIHRQDGKKE